MCAATPALCGWLVIGLLLTGAHAGRFRSTGVSGFRRARVAPSAGTPAGSPAPEPSCVLYQGRVCASLLYNITVLVTPPDTLAIIEERLRDALSVIQASPDLTQDCSAFAAPGLCLAALPPCVASGHARRICRDECELLRDVRCRREHAIARAHPIISQIVLPVCERLPPVGAPESPDCLRLGVPDAAPHRPEETCFQGDGSGYRGVESRAASGRRCHEWSRHSEYAQLARRQPAVRGGHAFCRTWPGERPQPWCYTATAGDSGVRAEPCAVPRCERPLLWYIWYIALPGGSVAVFIVLSALCCCICRCIRRKRPSAGSGDDKATVSTAETAASDPETASSQQPKAEAVELSLDDITFKEELGDGQFGMVFRGELSGHGPNGAPLPVAVKTLKEGASTRTERDFEREGRLLAQLCHPHIVRLLGVVSRRSPRCLVFERMSGGDLHALLVARSPRAAGAAGPPLSEQQLLHVAAQVADGMAYLSSHHYVHRDLAARNCLVGDNMTIKISDFGLSRDIYSSDYYRLHSRALLPVRWMPAESILYGKFTTESDVYSYGVLLWELFSFGLQPYYGYSSAEVVEMVRRRQLLPRPDDAAAPVYQLMLDCWHQTPARRPSFQQIVIRLHAWLRSGPTTATAAAGTGSEPPLQCVAPLAAAGRAGYSLWQLSQPGPATGAGCSRSASLPRGAVALSLQGNSLPRPAAPARLPRATEVVLGRVSSASSLPSTQLRE